MDEKKIHYFDLITVLDVFKFKKLQGVPVFGNQAQSVLFPVYQARLSQALITLSSLQITL